MFAIIDEKKVITNIIELDEKEAKEYAKHLPKGQTLVTCENARIGAVFNGTSCDVPEQYVSLDREYFEATVKSLTFTHITRTARLTTQANMAAYITELSFAEKLTTEQKKDVDLYRSFNAWVANVRKVAKHYAANANYSKLSADWCNKVNLPSPTNEVAAFAKRF